MAKFGRFKYTISANGHHPKTHKAMWQKGKYQQDGPGFHVSLMYFSQSVSKRLICHQNRINCGMLPICYFSFYSSRFFLFFFIFIFVFALWFSLMPINFTLDHPIRAWFHRVNDKYGIFINEKFIWKN